MGCSNSNSAETADSKPSKSAQNFEIVSGPNLHFYEMSQEQKDKLKKEMEEQDKELVETKGPVDPKKKYDWKEINEKLPIKTTIEERKKRLELWNKINKYGNGFVSFKRLSFQLTNYLDLPEVVKQKEPMKLAFEAACNKYSKYGLKQEDGLIEWMEFRIFLVYLKQYFGYWAMFESIDVSGDKKITITEFKKAVPLMEQWGVKISSPENEFKSIDSNKSGDITFDEFCTYAIKKSIDLEQDDKFDDEELKKLKTTKF